MGDSVCAHKELTGGWAKAAQLPRPDLSGLAIKDGHLKRALLGQDFLVVDGAMGTQLQERGLADAGQIPEMLNFSHPDDIAAIHKAYVDAGAEVITTNTFGANATQAGRCRERSRTCIVRLPNAPAPPALPISRAMSVRRARFWSRWEP